MRNITWTFLGSVCKGHPMRFEGFRLQYNCGLWFYRKVGWLVMTSQTRPQAQQAKPRYIRSMNSLTPNINVIQLYISS